MTQIDTLNTITPGVTITAAMAIPAWFLGNMIPLVGGPGIWNIIRYDHGLLAKTRLLKSRHFLYWQKGITVCHYFTWL